MFPTSTGWSSYTASLLQPKDLLLKSTHVQEHKLSPVVQPLPPSATAFLNCCVASRNVAPEESEVQIAAWSPLLNLGLRWLDIGTSVQVLIIRISISLGWKRVDCPPSMVERPGLKRRSPSIEGSCSQVRERWRARSKGGSVRYLMQLFYRSVMRKELSQKAHLKIKGLILYRELHLYPHLWS